jgi:hypothetical protein
VLQVRREWQDLPSGQERREPLESQEPRDSQERKEMQELLLEQEHKE